MDRRLSWSSRCSCRCTSCPLYRCRRGALAKARKEVIMRNRVDDLANRLLELNGSDLHLKAGTPPAVRVRGLLTYLEGYETLRPENTEGFAHVWLRRPA